MKSGKEKVHDLHEKCQKARGSGKNTMASFLNNGSTNQSEKKEGDPGPFKNRRIVQQRQPKMSASSVAGLGTDLGTPSRGWGITRSHRKKSNQL